RRTAHEDDARVHLELREARRGRRRDGRALLDDDDLEVLPTLPEERLDEVAEDRHAVQGSNDDRNKSLVHGGLRPPVLSPTPPRATPTVARSKSETTGSRRAPTSRLRRAAPFLGRGYLPVTKLGTSVGRFVPEGAGRSHFPAVDAPAPGGGLVELRRRWL